MGISSQNTHAQTDELYLHVVINNEKDHFNADALTDMLESTHTVSVNISRYFISVILIKIYIS